jgi:hypothetical protein
VVGVTPPFHTFQSGHTFLNTVEIVTNGWKKTALILIALAKSSTKFIGQIFTTTVLAKAGTKSNVPTATSILVSTTSGTTSQSIVPVVASGKKKHAQIVTVTAKFVTKSFGTTNRTTVPAKVGMRFAVATQTVAIPFLFTPLGQMFPSTARAVILGTKKHVPPVGVPKKSRINHLGVIHPSTVIPVENWVVAVETHGKTPET